ncbi:MAG: asparagine--tRNA ligase [Thermodesulfobacteriota bacterium]|nr:asparagine--tRNA ligase [Thermodesulfobacteriota bacterium]
MKKIKDILNLDQEQPGLKINGWVRTKRDAKGFSFLEVNDGSCLQNIQVIAEQTIDNYDAVEKLLTGSAVSVTGRLAESPGKGQKWEIHADRIDILSPTDDTYPLQKKRHTDEFLRQIAHLRPRTNKYGAMFRIRSEASFAVHQFFHERGFVYIQTPILTASDCEGAGELFAVAGGNPPIFDNDVYLTVSGQLSAEMFALSLGDVYTFGPTFRAENSNTPRHAAEFWMIEPEMAFCDLDQDMAVAETFIKQVITHVLDHCESDINLFARFVDKDLLPTLENIQESLFARITHSDAVEILRAANIDFTYTPSHDSDLQTEHERFLTEIHFKKPVIVYNYPRYIKPFYMRRNPDNETVAAMDILLPRIGELIGGSQREERLHVLEQQMIDAGVSKDSYWWYLDSRRHGSVPHSGFGLGFERFLMLITGATNIRDVIPFPRTPGKVEF